MNRILVLDETAGTSNEFRAGSSPADFKRTRRTPGAKIIRRALDLTQEEFAARYHIPLGTLRDWDQGRAEPDQPTRAYLTVIARDPEHVNRTLNPEAS